jgi:hypothetical protein
MSSVAVSAAFVLAWQEIILAFIRYQHIFQVSPPLSHTKLTMHVFFEIINSLGGAPGSKFQIWGQAPVRPESILGIELGRQHSLPSGLPLGQRPVLMKLHVSCDLP